MKTPKAKRRAGGPTTGHAGPERSWRNEDRSRTRPVRWVSEANGAKNGITVEEVASRDLERSADPRARSLG